MSEPGNGDNVTWRELSLALAPIKDGLSGVAEDVKALLADRSEERGRASAVKDVAARRYAALALFLAIAAVVVPAALGGH